ncbi:hypothetical protein LZ32DRAFT_387784 [Colletotrichum eremochloae]|nr:hypothetical protein LZ32DRAFT_387784 [Colletotrichum eremochloae]
MIEGRGIATSRTGELWLPFCWFNEAAQRECPTRLRRHQLRHSRRAEMGDTRLSQSDDLYDRGCRLMLVTASAIGKWKRHLRPADFEFNIFRERAILEKECSHAGSRPPTENCSLNDASRLYLLNGSNGVCGCPRNEPPEPNLSANRSTRFCRNHISSFGGFHMYKISVELSKASSS